jgi:hypothetical protein
MGLPVKASWLARVQGDGDVAMAALKRTRTANQLLLVLGSRANASASASAVDPGWHLDAFLVVAENLVLHRSC